MNRKMTLGAISFVILMELMLPLISVASAYTNYIEANPAIIDFGGQVTITLSTVGPATGTMTVIQKSTGNSWSMAINQSAGPNNYVFPTDPGWSAGANTNAVGAYDVIADIVIGGVPYYWHTSFQVEFFVVPEIPLGILMATIASFATLGMLKRYKTRQ